MPCTGVARQQSASDQLKALCRQIGHLERLAKAFGQPLHQVRLFQRRDLDGMPNFRRIDTVSQTGLTHEIMFKLCPCQFWRFGIHYPGALPTGIGQPSSRKSQDHTSRHATQAQVMGGVFVRRTGF